jgi:arylsulfatase A-like enzyme
MKLKEYGAEVGRLTLFGTLTGYGYTLLYYVGHLVFGGTSVHPDTLGNTGHAHLLFVVGALTLFPLVATAASLVTAALTTLVTDRFRKLSQKRRELIGLAAVAFVTTAVLGLPDDPANLGHTRTLVAYVAGIILGAGLVLAAVKWPGVKRWGRRIAGCVLPAAAVAFAAFYLWGLPGFDYPRPAGDAPGPNVLIVLSDAHRADWASTFGGEVPTPNLDRLAAMGVRYTRCYSASNWTLPSVASIFTGLEPAVHQVDWITPLPPLPTLPRLLLERGYRTWALFCNDAVSIPTGFYRDFESFANYSYLRTATLGSIHDLAGPLYIFFAKALCIGLIEADFQHVKNVPADLAVELAGELPPGGGVFAYVHLFDPHDPYGPPERYIEDTGYEGPYEKWTGFMAVHEINASGPASVDDALKEQFRNLYRGELRFEDEVVGRMLDALEESGAVGNTAVFFVADHGEAFWEHGQLGHGGQMYDEQIHVPLLAYWPGELQGGLVRTDPVSHTDIHPTVLELLGVEYDRSPVLARSLADPPSEGRPVFSERVVHREPELPRYQVAVHHENGSLIYRRVDGGRELYLPDDHGQTTEVGDLYPSLRDALYAMIEEYDRRNDEVREEYNPHYTSLSGAELVSELENLRAIGYIQ